MPGESVRTSAGKKKRTQTQVAVAAAAGKGDGGHGGFKSSGVGQVGKDLSKHGVRFLENTGATKTEREREKVEKERESVCVKERESREK